ncbi:hypothetical protein C8R42DRAFT_728348 [Lentinula raphanica]|nr:hypothetical protein C8R42DRAFT_728348 [Lentinula raphanica]
MTYSPAKLKTISSPTTSPNSYSFPSMLLLKATNSTSASCLRMLLTLSFVLWSLGIAKAGEIREYPSNNPVASGQPIMLTSFGVVLHTAKGIRYRNIDDATTISIGDRLITHSGLEPGHHATSAGSGSNIKIGFVHAPSREIMNNAIEDVDKKGLNAPIMKPTSNISKLTWTSLGLASPAMPTSSKIGSLK